MRINNEKNERHGFTFETPAEAVAYAVRVLEFFKYHNKNLTKEQDHKIDAAICALDCIDINE